MKGDKELSAYSRLSHQSLNPMHMFHILIPIERRSQFAVKEIQSTFNLVRNECRGFSLLIVVVMLGAALLIMSLGTLIIGLGEREGSAALREGGEALSVADGCVNEILLRIRRNETYGIGAGVIPFTVPNGSCSIQVGDEGMGDRQIDVMSAIAAYVKHIRVTANVSGGVVTVLSWEERSD
jgi:hypothetical protein